MGKLNHCAPFVIDYKRKVQPLIKLLSGEQLGKWRQEHTDALNTLGDLIRKKLTLKLVDQTLPLDLYVDVDDSHLSVVLS